MLLSQTRQVCDRAVIAELPDLNQHAVAFYVFNFQSGIFAVEGSLKDVALLRIIDDIFGRKVGVNSEDNRGQKCDQHKKEPRKIPQGRWSLRAEQVCLGPYRWWQPGRIEDMKTRAALDPIFFMTCPERDWISPLIQYVPKDLDLDRSN